MNPYLQGADVLGAFGDPARPTQFVTIHVKNVADLVKKQGGATGALVNQLVPQTIQNTVYDRIKSQLEDGFKQQGVDADVQVMTSPPGGGRSPRDLATGIGVGVVGVGAVWGLVKLFKWML